MSQASQQQAPPPVPQLHSKAWIVGTIFSLDMHVNNTRVCYGETNQKAKAEYWREHRHHLLDDTDRYIDLKTVRFPEDDVYLVNGDKTTLKRIEEGRQARRYLENAESFCLKHAGELVYINSWVRGLWGPDSKGYVGDIAKAGKYNIEQALSIIKNCGWDKKIQLILVRDLKIRSYIPSGK